MARPKKADTAAQTTEAEDEVLEQHDHAAAIELAKASFAGDVRNWMLDRLRHEQDKRPWDQRSEQDQRATVDDLDRTVNAATTKAIEILAAGGRRTIKATLSQVTVKDGIRAQLEISRHDERRHHLVDAQGSTVLIVVADSSEFEGEGAPAPIKPDQGDLVGDVGVVHSEADGAREVPFH